MRDCSGEWFHFEPLRKMIARTISKASTRWGRGRGRGQDRSNQPTNQTNNWPINWTTDQPKLRTIARQTRQTTARWSQGQLRTVMQRSQWARQFTQANNREPSTNRATEVEQFIREQSDCDKASDSSESGRIAISWPDNWPNNWSKMSTSISTPLEVGVGQSSWSGAKSLELARGLEPTAKPNV